MQHSSLMRQYLMTLIPCMQQGCKPYPTKTLFYPHMVSLLAYNSLAKWRRLKLKGKKKKHDSKNKPCWRWLCWTERRRYLTAYLKLTWQPCQVSFYSPSTLQLICTPWHNTTNILFGANAEEKKKKWWRRWIIQNQQFTLINLYNVLIPCFSLIFVTYFKLNLTDTWPSTQRTSAKVSST